jgi:transposase
VSGDHQGTAGLRPTALRVLRANPDTLAKYRKTFCLSRVKDDPRDAEAALELLLTHPEKLSTLQPQSGPMRVLQQLLEQRRMLVDEVRRITNRLTDALKQYFPQALEWFKDKDTVVFCDFLIRWPTLKQAQRARKARLVAFFREHNVRYPNVIEQRIQAIYTATPLTSDASVIGPNRLLVETLAQQLRLLLQSVERFDAEIAALAPTLPDYSLFAALPGAGPVFAPRLLAAFGEQRERFQSASQLQSYSGIAPVTEQRQSVPGTFGGYNVQSCCVRHSWNGPRCPFRTATGRQLTIDDSARGNRRTRLRCAR